MSSGIQTSYSAAHDPGFEGQRVDLQLTNIDSKTCEDGNIAFGRAVVRGTGDDQAKLPTATGQAFLGITEYTSAGNETSSGLHLYEQYKEANILNFGQIYAYTEESVVPGNAVYFRHTADTAPLDVVGRFRKDASGGDADLITGATWETTTAAGGIGIINLNTPGVGVLLSPDSSETITATTAVAGITTSITYVDTTLGAMAASLADGTEGQYKYVTMLVDGGDCTITPANLLVGTTVVLADVGDSVLFRFSGSDWHIVSTYNVGIGVQTILASGAISLQVNVLEIDTVSTAAQADTLADGVEGQAIDMVMTVDGADAVVTPANYLNGTTLTFDDAGDSARLIFLNGNWNNVGTPTATVA